MNADHEAPRRPRWGRELAGVATAIAIAIPTVAIVASSPRSELLFRDGDSLITTLVTLSVATGQPQDWAMSTVLFLPEIAGVAALSLFGLGVTGTLAVAAVLSLVALYGVLRVVAGSARRSRAPIAGALFGLAAFALFAASESSASRDALEPASLLLTTTYYSATVLAVIVAVGLARCGLETPTRRWTVWVLAGVAAASVLTNPLFAAWATVPLGLVLGAVALRSSRAAARRLVIALVAGSAVGLVARMPLAHLIANTGAGYADPSQWLASIEYYAGLVVDRWSTSWGALAVMLGLALWIWCVVATVLLARRGEIGAAVVAACGWLMPLLVVVGAIVLGTHAARYLEPIAFGPVLGLVLLPEFAPRVTRTRATGAIVAAAVALGLVAAGAFGIPRIVTAASTPDPDLDCVVDWVDASGRTGGGQFWTVRLPKAHLDDPRRLVQVDHELRGYAWLVNREDFAVGEVSFLVLDAQSPDFDLPGGATLDDADLVSCGRYTIADFGERALPLGPQRS